uniref:SSD domain-containing protein n=1 Tax=Ditylenchus dipsaci TaxID=166011 RepID=A0A915ELK0_9BILA
MSGCTRALRRRSQQTECAEELRSDDQVLYRNQLQTRNQTSRVEDELTSRPNSTETMDIPLRTLPTLSSDGEKQAVLGKLGIILLYWTVFAAIEFINAIQQLGQNNKPRTAFTIRSEKGPKTMKLQAFLKQISLRNIFRLLGCSIGTYPVCFLLVAILMASFSLVDVFKEFLGSQGDPLVTTVLLRARDGGSMHRMRYLEEAVRLHNYLRKNLTLEFRPEDEPDKPVELVKYLEICGPFCDSNIVLDYFTEALKDEWKKWKLGQKRYESTQLVKKFLWNESPDDLQFVTTIKHIEAIIMTFKGSVSHPDDEAKMSQWEMKVYQFSSQLPNNSLIEMLVLGNEIVDYEMNKDAQKTAPYFLMGFFFMFTFVFYTLLLALALGISLCPTLAITSTFGICSLIGLRTNSVMLLMPFLICGIGKCGDCRQTGLVLEEIGPSITITTLTNVITFGIGALTPTPEISLFCLATAIALGFAYLYTLVLFTPFIYFATLVENRSLKTQKDSPCSQMVRRKLNTFFNILCSFYCRILTNKVFVLLLSLGTLVYWYFAIMGTLNINAKLDTEKILPKQSPILEPHRLISHMVWAEYYPVTILVNNPLDIRSKQQLDRFNAMLDEFESLEKCKGKKFTQLWLRDYIQYCQMVKEFGFDYFSQEDQNTASNSTETGLDFSKLKEFLSSPFYKHYSVFLKMAKNNSANEVPVAKFWFLVTFHNTSSWDDRIDLMVEWRSVAQKYNDLNVTVWEVNGMFVDQMLSLKSLTLQTTVLTLACMTIVCAIFIQNPVSVATAVFAILSISIGVIGYLSWWHLNLDPVTLCAVLMSIGMSVDFTAHVSYHFQLTSKREIQMGEIVEVPLVTSRDKLFNAIQAIAWPMSQAGLSTVICVLPLIFLQNYIPLVFVKTVTLVAIWGLFHGLVLLPCFLAALPPKLLEMNCYKIVFRSKANRLPIVLSELDSSLLQDINSLNPATTYNTSELGDAKQTDT